MWGEDEPSDGVVLCSTHPLSQETLSSSTSKQTGSKADWKAECRFGQFSLTLSLSLLFACLWQKKKERAGY